MKYVATVRDLSVTYDGRVKALDDVSLKIPIGQIAGLIGPSGSGKTTLIKSIVGQLKLPANKVAVLGLSAGAGQLRERVAYMSQELAVYDDLTVRQNLIYFARIIGLSRLEVKTRVEEILHKVDLSDQKNQLVTDLSGGQKQRVSLAVALLGQPELLVLDEPTVGLDPLLIENLWKLFREITGKGATLIVSSHSMTEAARCDDLVLMHEGKIIAIGSPSELEEKTKSRNIEQAFLKLVRQTNKKEPK
ncbi:ABC transporter ATP-binding protein [Candidatus Saccharibacteria bacterium]|nr:ABC transporter ATP-binding protein [Candidatus Saccharibacteria bacterium]